ncbi:MAG: ribosome assembly factor SBDS [Nanoarchaeota archaeon]|nr:ribosome assembly factor SBDS [Nanoarchaeota archaeon]
MTVSVENAVIARITKGGEKFEILVDPRKALEVKGGKDIPLDELVAVEELYEDVGKGLRVSEEKINKAFGTNDLKTIIYKIIKQGDVQLTTEQRKEFAEKKRKTIVNIIAKQGINPQNNLPHPAQRIENAMEQAKVKIALEQSAEEQVESILKQIQAIIPIRFETVRLSIKIPAQYAGKAAGTIRGLGKIIKDEWKGDGSYFCMIEIPGGMQQDVYDKLSDLTHGQFEVKKD